MARLPLSIYHRKKGSLSLSINAIVVLILAITMLGLGLGFMRTMFGKASQSLEQAAATEADPSPASLNNPVTLSKSKLVFEADKSGIIKISMYNDGVAIAGSGVGPTVSCVPYSVAINNFPETGFIVVGSIQSLLFDANSPQTFAVAIKKADKTAGSGICTVSAIVNTKNRRADFAVEAVLSK